MGADYELIDHTGDVGFVVRGPSPMAVLERSAAALFDIVAGIETIRPTDEIAIRVAGAVDREDLLVRFLSELLFLHDARDWMVSSVRIESLEETAVRAVARGERFDPDRHEIVRQVKAVTYHGLSFEKVGETWEARIVLDL